MAGARGFVELLAAPATRMENFLCRDRQTKKAVSMLKPTPPGERSSTSGRKRAFVTGASEGIGRVFARELARQGFAVTALARNAVRLHELVGELPGSGHRPLVADLGRPEGLRTALEAVEAERYNVLVNNAGFGLRGDFTRLPLERQLEMIRVNVDAVVALAHAFLAQAAAGDRLVNVSSVVATLPHPTHPVYTATKAFVTSFSESLWANERRRGVQVVAVHPGATATRFAERAGTDPRMRRFGMPVQSAEAVVREALAAIAKGRGPVVVTGMHNRLIARIARLLPRRLLLIAASRV